MLSTRPRQRTERVTKQIPTTNEALKTDEESMLTLSFVLHLAVFFYYSSATLVRSSSCDTRKKKRKSKDTKATYRFKKEPRLQPRKFHVSLHWLLTKPPAITFYFLRHTLGRSKTLKKRINKTWLAERVMMELLPSRCQCRDNERDVRSAQVRYAD